MWNYRASAIRNIGHVSASPRVVQELPVLIEWIFSQPELCIIGVGGADSRPPALVCTRSMSVLESAALFYITWGRCSDFLCFDDIYMDIFVWACMNVDCLGLADKKWGCSAGCGGSIGHVLARNRPQRCAWNSTLPWDTYYYFVTRPCRYVIHLGWAIEHKLC